MDLKLNAQQQDLMCQGIDSSRRQKEFFEVAYACGACPKTKCFRQFSPQRCPRRL
jgi:hypothetical protein